nr:BatA domain-containing protein [Acetobacter persici]
MIFLAPLALFGLLTLPLVWWLLRATPPAPRVQRFPAVALLRALRPHQTDAVRSPLWLLLVRLAAVACLVLGLAQPVLPGDRLPSAGHGPLLLVMDDGLFAASDWSRRIATAQGLVDDADHAGRTILFFRTAPAADGHAAQPPAPRSAAAIRQELDSMRPAPWRTDRAAAAHALATLPHTNGSVLYLADGVASGGDEDFARALRAFGPVQEIRFPDASVLTLAPAAERTGTQMARLLALPLPAPRSLSVRVHAQDGGRWLSCRWFCRPEPRRWMCPSPCQRPSATGLTRFLWPDKAALPRRSCLMKGTVCAPSD